ncbi:hypothetical protein ACFLZ6_00510 [Nanoarchaeota archaeon]
MITIFSSPKAFKGHISIIQKNAIKSWTLLEPKPEIILMGNERGTAEICKKLKLKHISDVKCNDSGTPLVNDIFKKAQKRSNNKILCYVNSDIILTNDFMGALSGVDFKNFLMIGQRWDIEMKKPLNFKPSWEKKLSGKKQHPAGMDYFVFTKNIWKEIPSFAIGRTIWDNWLVYKALLNKAPIIDASKVVKVIHQNHGYGSISKKNKVWKGPEADYNLKLAGPPVPSFSLHDATHILTKNGVKRALSIKYLVRRIRRMPSILRSRIKKEI